MSFHIVHAHDLKAEATALGLEYCVDLDRFATVMIRRLVGQFRLKAILALKDIVCVDHMSLDDLYLAGAVCQIDESLVAKLELSLHSAVVHVGEDIGLSQRGVDLQTKLCAGHHRTQETSGRTLAKLGIHGDSR